MSTLLTQGERSQNGSGVRRRLFRRRPLPSGRAVVGGLLVAIAAAGTFAASTRAGGGRPSFVVAARNLTVGEQLTAGDVKTEPMALPADIGDNLAFRTDGPLLGTVVVAPLQAGELLQVSDLVEPTGARGSRDVSFPIDPARAVDGALQPGDHVDVLATFGTGTQSTTSAVVTDAPVVSFASTGSAFDASGDDVVTLALPTPSDVLALTEAVNNGQILLARSTGDAPASYSPASGGAPG